jgi:uncharacterized protein (DUF3084 family)
MYGDTAVIRQRASDLDHDADDLRARASSMISRASDLDWHSTAANAFRSKISDRAHSMGGTGQKLDAAAVALRAHAAEVDRVKAEIEQAMHFVQSVWDSAHTIVVNAIQVVKTVATTAVNDFMKVVDTVHDAVADVVNGDGGKVVVHVFEMFGQEVSQATVDRARDVTTTVPSLPVAGDKQWLDVRDTFNARGWTV